MKGTKKRTIIAGGTAIAMMAGFLILPSATSAAQPFPEPPWYDTTPVPGQLSDGQPGHAATRGDIAEVAHTEVGTSSAAQPFPEPPWYESGPARRPVSNSPAPVLGDGGASGPFPEPPLYSRD